MAETEPVDPAREALALKLTELLRVRGIKKTDLAAKLGVGDSRITKWLNHDGDPRPQHLVVMGELLGVTLNYLCDQRIPVGAWREHGASPASETLGGPESILRGICDRLGVEEVIRRALVWPEIATGPATGAIESPSGPNSLKPVSRSQLDPERLEAKPLDHDKIPRKPKR